MSGMQSNMRRRAKDALRRLIKDTADPHNGSHAHHLIQRLQEYQSELENQNNELRNSMEKLNLLTEERLQLLNRVNESTIEGILITDAYAVIKSVNSAFSSITGYSKEEVIGKNPKILKSDRHNKEFYREMWHSLIGSGHWEGEIWNRRKNGEAYPEWMIINAVRDSHGKTIQYVSVFLDLTDIKRNEAQLKYKTFHDALTGLPNRLLFNDRLDLALTHAHRNQQMAAVISLDLDRFKKINNILGHAVGDELLQKVAGRLKSCIREGDTVCRTGGDEFVFIIEGFLKIEDVTRIVDRIFKAFSHPIKLKNSDHYITPSMGIAVYPNDGRDRETLIKNADTAMYRAKESGRNTFQLYTQLMNSKASKLLILESSLHNALDKGEFVVYYQPIADLSTGQITGMEALVRWLREGNNLVSPNEFIPLAEETGLILPIGEWVLRTACEQTKKWHSAGYQHLCISVNLSARQFQQMDLVDMVRSALDETGLSPHNLNLEITESIVMSDVEKDIATMHNLSKMGINISMDDFGTGYCSLAYLKEFPINFLKIDRSFILDIASSQEAGVIASTIIAMARSLNLKVIAEGVETEEQLNFLIDHGCDKMQGYFFSRPLPWNEFNRLLNEGKHLSVKKNVNLNRPCVLNLS